MNEKLNYLPGRIAANDQCRTDLVAWSITRSSLFPGQRLRASR
ncbi:hypothetical protein [Sphingomonas sp. Leaf339]|nr:hypothetical protein [Sphingomonas sp. Leaf339]